MSLKGACACPMISETKEKNKKRMKNARRKLSILALRSPLIEGELGLELADRHPFDKRNFNYQVLRVR